METSNPPSEPPSKPLSQIKQTSSPPPAAQQTQAPSKVPSQPAPVDEPSLTDAGTDTRDGAPAHSTRSVSHHSTRHEADAGSMRFPSWQQVRDLLAEMIRQRGDQMDDTAEPVGAEGDVVEPVSNNYVPNCMKRLWALWESCTLYEKYLKAFIVFMYTFFFVFISDMAYTGKLAETYAQAEPTLSQISDYFGLVFGFLWTTPIAFQFLVGSILGFVLTLIVYYKYQLIHKEVYQRLVYRGGLFTAVAFALAIFHGFPTPDDVSNALSNGLSALANSSSPHVNTIIQYLPARTVTSTVAGVPNVSGNLAAAPTTHTDIRSGMITDATTTVTEYIAASPIQPPKAAKSAKALPPKSARELLALGPQHALKITLAAQPIEPVASGIRTLGSEIYNLWVKLEKNAIDDGTLRGPDSRAQLRSWIKLMRQTEQSSRSVMTKFQYSVDDFVGWWEEETDRVVKELRKIEATGDELSVWRKGQRSICLLAAGQCDDPLEVLRRRVLQRFTDRVNRRLTGVAGMAKVAHEAGHDLQTMVEKIVRIASGLDHRRAKEHSMLARGQLYYQALKHQEKWTVFKLKGVEEDEEYKVKDSVEALELSYAMFNQYKAQVGVIRRELAELSKVMESVGKAMTSDRLGVRTGRDWNTNEIQENARKAVAALEG